MENKFWTQDFSVLFKNNNWLKFVPTNKMGNIEKLNSMARYFLYLGVILYFFKNDKKYLILGLMGMVFTIYLFKNKEVESFTETCTKPTYDNPYMNVLVNEYNDDKLPPCKLDTAEKKEDFNQKKNFNLYKDVSDIFERENFERHFTVPTTDYINNQTEFAKWLYSNDTVCKEDLNRCINNDLRRN
jgi:hypothetical protein